MTSDDYLTLFLGQLADAHMAKKVKLTPAQLGFADDCRFAMNLSKNMRKFAQSLFATYGTAIGWKDLTTPPRQ